MFFEWKPQSKVLVKTSPGKPAKANKLLQWQIPYTSEKKTRAMYDMHFNPIQSDDATMEN